ncbi:MAG: NAD-dependent epimerase/dehydratase family protein [Acidimicrobiia bacterium]|nr:NAD-dependent epimerase/dehydratase family protein [Acidimicrobiia bacterium]
MTVLLTGYPGHLGRSLARRLVAGGHEVRAVLHRRAVDRRDRDPGVELVWGDVGEKESRDELVAGVDAVVHAAWDFRRVPHAERVNVDGSVDLYGAAAEAGVGTFVFISSVAVYGLEPPPGGGPVGEDTPFVAEDRALDVYPWAKVRVERALREQADDGPSLTVVRPGLLFGPNLAPAKRLVRGRYALLVGRGSNHLPYVHVADVADLVARAVRRGASGTFNAVPSAAVGADAFLRGWARREGRDVRVVHLPPAVFAALSLGPYAVKRLLGRDATRPNVAYQTATALRDVRYSSARARRELGWEDVETRAVVEAAGLG